MSEDISFAQADRLYRIQEVPNIYWDTVIHPIFREFSKARQQFWRNLGDTSRDTYWANFNRWLFRFWFCAVRAPIPFSHASIYSQEVARQFRQHLSTCEELYPGAALEARWLLEQAEKLADSGENPLGDRLDELLRKLPEASETALVVQEPHLFAATEEALRDRGLLHRVLLASPFDLRARAYEQVIITGPVNRLPNYLLASPRASDTHIVSYDWPKQFFEAGPLLAPAPSDGKPQRLSMPKMEIEKGDENESHTFEIAKYVGQNRSYDDLVAGDPLEVNAKLIILEGGEAVLLESGGSALVVDPDEEGRLVVRKQVANVEAGMFLLLKKGGGGDYIIPVADGFLGENAAKARAAQSHWKRVLKQVVAAYGLQGAEAQLRSQGAVRANDWNLRNWMADDTIRPWEKGDFLAIMKVGGLGEKAEEYWALMGAIEAAHTRAGQSIRKQLLRQVSSADVRNLERLGRMDFTVQIANGVSITAYRVVEAYPGSNKVPQARLNRPFDPEEQTWPE